MAFTDSGTDSGPPPGLGAGPPGAGPAGAAPSAAGAPEGGGGLLEALQAARGGAPNSMPGDGTQAKAMTTIMNAVQMINSALQGLDPTSRVARDVRRAIDQLSRHMPQGNATAGAQKTDLMDTLRTVAQTALSQNMPQSGGQNPMSSTPLPGA